MASARTTPEAWWGRARARRDGEPKGARRSGRRWPGPVRALVVIVLGFYVLYLLVANVLVGTGLLAKVVNREPEDLRVSWSSAYSLVPGWVTVSDFRFRFQDHNVQFHLAIDHADLRVDLLSLASKRFHLTRVRARGVEVRTRMKVDSTEGREARLAAFPPIEGWEGPPLKTPKKPRDPHQKLWVVHLEDVEGSVRELWFLELRWVGEARVRGAFRLHPTRELDVWPAALELQEGELTVGGSQVVHTKPGELFATVHHVDVRVPKGLEILRFVDARARLSGEVASLTPLASLYTEGSDVRASGGVGDVDIDAEIRAGIFSAGSRLALRLAEVDVTTPRASVRAPVTLNGTFEGPDAPPLLRLDASAPGAVLFARREGADAAKHAAMVREAHVVARLAAADVVTRQSAEIGSLLRGADVTVRELAVPDLAALGPLEPADVHLQGGTATLAARATLDGRAFSGRVDAALGRARARVSDAELAASGAISVDLATKDVTHALGGSLEAQLREVAVTTSDVRANGLAVNVHAHHALVQLPSGSLGAMIDVRARPGERVLEAAAGAAGAPRWLGRAAAGDEAHAELRLEKGPGSLELRLLDATDGAVHAKGILRKDARAGKRGAFLVEAGVLHAGIVLGRGTEVVPFADDGWLDARVRALP